MFKTTIIKIDSFTSSKGKPCKVAWFTLENGLPAKCFIESNSSLKANDTASVTIESDFNCNAKVVVK